MSPENLYQVLGVSRTAKDAEIKRAFSKLARKLHPEVNPGDEAARAHYEKVCRAWEVLGQPGRRGEYDRLGHEEYFRRRSADAERAGAPPAEGAWSAAGATGLLGALLGPEVRGGVPGRPSGRGDDIQEVLDLTFDDAARGVARHVRVSRRVSCPECGGSGAAAGGLQECAACRGAGMMEKKRGPLVTREECAACRGTGRLVRLACRPCGGAGVSSVTEDVAVDVPAGVAAGSEVRVRGAGHAGSRGGPPGDLVVITRVGGHADFVRKGDNVYGIVPVMVWEAALGADILVPTLAGSVPLRIPPGTQGGQRFQLHGKGVPNLKTGRRGAHFVEIAVVVPAPSDEAARKAYRRLAELFPENPRRK